MSGAGSGGRFLSSASLRGKPTDSQAREAAGAQKGRIAGQGEPGLCGTCRCSPNSTSGGSRTVQRILAACMVSLFTLLGAISLDLSSSFEMWRNTEKALQEFSSCENLLAFRLIVLLQEERHLCCWDQPARRNGSWHAPLLERLNSLCQKTEETYSKNHQCKEEKGSACGIYITKIRQRLNNTWDVVEPGVVLSGVISELLEAFDSPNEDLITVRSNPDWADVMSLRLILRIKEVVLQAHEMPKASTPPRSLQSAWQPITTILNYAILTSENVQMCWMENVNLSRYFTHYEGISLFIPFLGSSPPIPSRGLAKELNYVQSCLLQKGHEKLHRKSKEIISTISLKITLLAIACLIYPIVLVSFKQMTDWIQNYARSLKERTEDLKRERRLAEDLLHQMLPKSVAKQLRKHKHVQAENYDQVTIFFSDIVGFTSIAASCTPLQVVEMLNNLYNCFDTRIESYDVYKIETIGDAYMVVSGLPERNGEKHADEIAKMSLDLVAAVRQVPIPHMPTGRLQLRAGIHTGPCVAGVVGYKMPRYCLFGDTVNTASRMESTSLPQKIHISSATYHALLTDDAYEIELRGEIEIKGKGKMKTYWLLGNKNYSVQNDSLVCHWNPAISRKKKMEKSLLSARQSSTGTVGAVLSERSTLASQDGTGSASHTRVTSDLAWTSGSSISEAGREPKNGSHHSYPQSFKNNIVPLGSPVSGQGDNSAHLDQGEYLGDYGSGLLEKNGFLPGFVDGM
ncbi:uncharacterized protein LOC127038716 isoform X1 [Gopherus flavomarginatus]|uniref:uncharacterized protein LOC127038716 isoform X1 n=1 Tax=Gopherus flavomarginatus TaxID=286002 RepID=UPI0021CBD020|nr:uncharacterized protein LOC127038716 isoform X1 [Gopherus flavomarginatus]